MKPVALALILIQYNAPGSGYTNPDSGYSAGVYSDGTSWQSWTSRDETIYLDSRGHSCYTAKANGQTVTVCN